MNITKISREQAEAMAKKVIRNPIITDFMQAWEENGFIETKFDIDLQRYRKLNTMQIHELTFEDKIFLFNFIETLLKELKK